MFHRPIYSTTGGGGAAEAATTRSSPPISMATPLWAGPVFHSSSSVMTIRCRSMPTGPTYRRWRAAPLRHPDPKHERPIPAGVSFATADGSRAEFKISDRLLKSANQLSDQSFFIRTTAAIMSKKPWYTRFESPITLELPAQSPREGEGTLEYFELN